MAKTIKKIADIEIPIVFHNYKLLKDKEFVLKGSNVYFIQGPNKVGKTSFLKALTSLQTASDDTPVKVTKGESEGFYEAKIPAADGSIITIRHEFTDTNKGRFIAVKEDGTKVSSVTEIRALFNYTPINVSEFFAMSNTAEGRRKQRGIILKLLSEKEKSDFEQYDLEEQHYYDTRTDVNNKLSSAKEYVAKTKPSTEDIDLIPKKEEANALLQKYSSAIVKMERVKEITNEIADLKAKIAIMEANVKVISEDLGDIVTMDPQEIQERVDKGRRIMERIITAEAAVNTLAKNEKEVEDLTKESENLTKKIDIARGAKDAIIANSDLPVQNISFEDGYLSIDGFLFKENQVCESDAVIILANILAKINPGPIQIIGDASILDDKKLDMLNSIAEKNNKIMFVDEVIRDSNDIAVVGYEEVAEKDIRSKLMKISGTEKLDQKEEGPLPEEKPKENPEKPTNLF